MLRYLIIFLIFSTFISFELLGIEDRYTSRLEGSDLQSPNASILLMENQYPLMEVDLDWRDKWQYRKVENKVTLLLNSKVTLTTNLSATVTIEVSYVDEDGVEGFEQRTLGVSYDTEGTNLITDKSSFVFSGGHVMEVAVIDVNIDEGDINALVLEAEIAVERYFRFDQTATVEGLASTSEDGYITFYWDHKQGAETYELEYVHVNDYTLKEGVFKSPENLGVDFYKNSTRVSTSDNWYKIPAVFDHGYVVYRVRGVGRHWEDVTKRKEGKWNAPTKEMVANYPQNHKLAITQEYLLGTKNWSYQAAMTEEAKRMEGVSYADGLGRPRQQVMRNPATDQTIVSNTYYDYHGRPVIQDLGTPVDDAELKHYPEFNRSANDQEAYQAKHFDNQGDPSAANCAPMPDAFHQDYGAGNYYSPANTQADGANQYVPDAQGYPFAHIEYMPDQTGRIKRVGAYGATHQVSGKSSEYIYSTPSQEELNVLFGSEVGWNHQYQKRLMKDANGQLYITYYDLAGRVVASGMAGEGPESLEKLEGVNVAGNFTQSILDGSQQSFSVSWSKPEYVSSEGMYYFNYSITPEQYTDLCNDTQICFDCVYDLTIKISPAECEGEEPVFEQTIQINGEDFDKVCTTPEQYQMEELGVTLTQGMYHITRELSVNEASVDAYWCMYLEENTCVESYWDIFNTYYEQEDFDWCLNPEVDLEELQEGDFEYSCEYYEAMMLRHFLPGQQYALYDIDPATGEVDASNYPLSIFNTSNNLKDGVTWQTPTEYLDNQGEPIYVEIEDLGGGVYSPEVVSTAPNDLIEISAGVYTTSPSNLVKAEDFIQLMRYEDKTWTQALLSYHPEYCYLDFCWQNTDSEDYDKAMQEVQLHEDACNLGYYNPLDYTPQTSPDPNMPLSLTFFNFNTSQVICMPVPTPSEDPFFSKTGHQAYKAAMQAAMEAYYMDENSTTLDIWSYALLMAQNEIEFDGELTTAVLEDLENLRTGEICFNDLLWETYRNLYLGLKQKYVALAMLDHAMENDCFSGCFGNANFSPSIDITNFDDAIPHTFDDYQVLGSQQSLNPSPSSNTEQPCHSSTRAYYEDKTPVFGAFWDMYSTAMDYATDQAEFEQEFEATNQEQCMTTCEQSADDWVNGLLECENLTPAIKANIRAELIELCQLGCPSGQNPQGVYNVPPPLQTTNGNSTFEEVLEYHLSSVSPNYGTDECMVLLMRNLPPLYGSYADNVDNIVANQYLDNCGCDLLAELSTEFHAIAVEELPEGVTTLSDFIRYKTGSFLSQGEVFSLLCACNQAYDGEWTLPSNWGVESIQALKDMEKVVPPTFTCNQTIGVGCLDCNTVSTGFQDLHDEFIANGVTDITTVINSFNYELIVANFFNLHYGFSLSGEEYIRFYNGCQATSQDPYCEPTTFATNYLEGVLDVLAKRGQLLTPSSAPIDLIENNVVYAHAKQHVDIPTQADLYWTCEGSGDCTDETLTLYVGSGVGHGCAVSLTLVPEDEHQVVTFDQVIGFSDLAMDELPESCGEHGGTFTLIAHYLDCGEVKQVFVTATSSCADLYECVCGDNGQELCDRVTPELDPLHCYNDQLYYVIEKTESIYTQNLEERYTDFKTNYTQQCELASLSELFTSRGNYHQYQFTLFYYDQAGNLVKTIAPEGVDEDFVDGTTVSHGAIKQARQNVAEHGDTQTTGFFPNHTYVTEYHYNSYGQLTQTTNPDQEGYTEYFYDRYGRIVASQNPHQQEANIYSYTFYDNQGRPKEVGQILQPTNVVKPSETILKTDDLGEAFKNWVENNNGTKGEVTITIYDEPLSTAIENQFTNGQKHLRLRVGSILYFDVLDETTDITTDYTTATHYSYDIHGNVVETIQDVPMMAPVEQDKKKTNYEFELISGNMKAVHYQQDERDGYSHFYHYDALNRLTEVQITTDNAVNVSTEARYHYYDYGPLARVELGEYHVQGMDYAYTINGWIKGMNSNTLDATRDMGKDGVDASQDPQLAGYLSQQEKIHSHFAKDVFGFTLNYFEGDYHPVGQTAAAFEANYSETPLGDYNQNLYNGNIRHVVTAIEGLEIQGYGYKYDQLQRLKEMQVFRDDNLVANNNWNTSQATDDYLTTFSYDNNGNLLNLHRNGHGTELDMDRFAYNYLDINGEQSNRLDYVNDTGTDYASYDDIKTGQVTGNYKYNKLGELIEDVQENMILHWRYGDHKLQKIERTDDDSPEVEFFYNPLGVRVGKLEKPRENGQLKAESEWKYHYYAYDANGMLMAVYDSKLYAENGLTNLEERYIYGAKRIGAIKEQVTMYNSGMELGIYTDLVDNTLGQKHYELKNHLGTVNVTISDRKTYNSLEDAFEATVTNYAETYPFGMLMPNRSFNADGQRYLYHGMEQDMEVSGSGNSYTTEFRQYDPRLGRWKSLDPLAHEFPWSSPYVAFNNNPIVFIDPDGRAAVNASGDVDDNYLIKSDGSIEVERTDDPTDNFKYENSKGEVIDLGTFSKNKKGLVNITSSGTSYDITNTRKSKRYMKPEAFAAFLGASMNYYEKFGLKIQVNQFSTKSGGHSNHGGSGEYIDYRYSNTNGNKNEPVWTEGNLNNFDKEKSQYMVDQLILFGYNSTPDNLRGTKYSILTQQGSKKLAALDDTGYYDGHHHHVHLQNYDLKHVSTVKSLNYSKPVLANPSENTVKEATERRAQENNHNTGSSSSSFWRDFKREWNNGWRKIGNFFRF